MKVERLDAIRSHLYAHGFSTIQSLADSVGASLATIRRDLQVLEREGAIDRVHGGARIAEGSSVEVAFQERAKRNLVRQARHRRGGLRAAGAARDACFSMPARPSCSSRG